MMDAAALGAILRSARADLFRLETLDYYEPDEAEFRRYMAGGEPDLDFARPWLERLRAERERGLRRRRARVIRPPVSDYARYEAEWAYTRNTEAGEEIRILDLGEHPHLAIPVMEDFWVVDETTVVLMRYDSAGRFTGAEQAPTGARSPWWNAQAVIWEMAEPFGTWWDRHREYHRDRMVA